MREKIEIIDDLKKQAKRERENKKVLVFETSNRFQTFLQELGDLDADTFSSLDDLMDYLEKSGKEDNNKYEEILNTVIGGAGV